MFLERVLSSLIRSCSVAVILQKVVSRVSLLPLMCKSMTVWRRPSLIIATLSQIFETRSRLWELKKTVLPSAQWSSILFKISTIDWWSSPIIGSSSTQSLGLCISADNS